MDPRCGAEDKLDGLVAGGEVVLRRLDTPRPMLHLMASSHHEPTGQWGSFWDQHRGGFSCVDSVLAGRMTSHLDTNYVPTAPGPQDVRELFIHEGGASWPIFPVAGYEEQQYADFECRLGMDTYEVSCLRAGIEGRLHVLVHPSLPLEVWRLSLANRTDAARKLSWFFRLNINVDSYPFYYFVPRVVCEGRIEDGATVFLNHDQNNRHPRAAFLAAAEPLDGFDMMAEVFDGGPGRAAVPAAVARGRCFDSPGLQPYAGLIAAGQFDAKLPAAEQRTWTLVYGRCPVDERERRELVRRVRDEVLSRPAEAAAELAGIWRREVRSLAIRTPDVKLDRYFNVWSRYQARNQARFVRALDKVGCRDVLQDLLGVYDHACLAVRNLWEKPGPRGLCRIGYGDWNDALSKIGGERGASVWLSCAFVYACGKMARIADWIGRRGDQPQVLVDGRPHEDFITAEELGESPAMRVDVAYT